MAIETLEERLQRLQVLIELQMFLSCRGLHAERFWFFSSLSLHSNIILPLWFLFLFNCVGVLGCRFIWSIAHSSLFGIVLVGLSCIEVAGCRGLW